MHVAGNIRAHSSGGRLLLEDTNVANGSTPFYLFASDSGNLTFTSANRNASNGTTGSTERMRITSSGQMGLGTNNPVQQAGTGLHIHNAGGQTRIKLTNNITGSTANDGFDIIQEHNNDVHILNHENGILKIGTNDAERMRIDLWAVVTGNID